MGKLWRVSFEAVLGNKLACRLYVSFPSGKARWIWWILTVLVAFENAFILFQRSCYSLVFALKICIVQAFAGDIRTLLGVCNSWAQESSEEITGVN